MHRPFPTYLRINLLSLLVKNSLSSVYNNNDDDDAGENGGEAGVRGRAMSRVHPVHFFRVPTRRRHAVAVFAEFYSAFRLRARSDRVDRSDTIDTIATIAQSECSITSSSTDNVDFVVIIHAQLCVLHVLKAFSV